jgi:alpha-glucosidase
MRFARSLPFIVVAVANLAPAQVNVSSPNGEVVFHLEPASGGHIEYRVTFRSKPVIEPSPIGITIGGSDISRNASLGPVARYEVNETYPWNGPHSTAADRSKGARISISGRVPYTLEVRAFDDGIAFRHIVPGAGVRVPGEATAFALPEGSVLWLHDFEGHYEGQHVRKSLRAVAPGEWAACPLTFRLPANTGYASITEAVLRAYSGMGLQAGDDGVFHARLADGIPASYPFRLRYKDLISRMAQPAAIEGPITTPWRVVIVGADLNTIVNSDIPHNLAPPPDPKLFPGGIHTSWVKPGRAVWSYLDGGNHTPDGMKEFSRLASDLGFEYNVLEGFWSRWSEAQLKDVADYSRKIGVGLILWKHSNGLRTPQQIEEFFALCNRAGAAGAKIDFFDSEHKEIVDLYEMILRHAAEHQLIIDFHGANKPTGLERTWPNMLGLEGIRGMEGRPPYAQHDATLPFTRMLAGLADYTPTIFSRRMGDTTWAHQIANAVILQAPLLVYAAHPANILANPAAGLMKSIPSTWDETVVLPASDIGEVAAFARRKGGTWFIAVTNGVYAKTIQVDLSFLGEGSYLGFLVRDGTEAASVKIEHLSLRRSDTLFIQMPSGGGFVARLAR